MAIERRLYTVEEFEQYADAPENRERLLELVNGVIVERWLSEWRGVVAGNIGAALANFAHPRKFNTFANYAAKESMLPA